LFGEQGHPIRTTISEMGPLLLARLMGLNDTQEGVLAIAFRYADDHDLLLLDLEDLQAMLSWCADNAGELSSKYGNVTKASVGSIQRQLLTLESQGGAAFFGEPAFDISDFIALDSKGRGRVNILAADKLMNSPRLYATFLLWLLAELFETLPEIGDPDRPKLVFFFDEAHLLFDEAPDALMDKVEQVVRLIRSKGVGVYFVTQNPIDIPENVAGQLGNRVQHALRAFTPRDARAIKSASETFRPNPRLDVAQVITEMKVGEALVSTLMPDGAPSPVERTRVAPPRSRVGPLTTGERMDVINASPFAGKYEELIDRESAAELLLMKREEQAGQAQAEKDAALQAKLDAQAAKEQARLAVKDAPPDLGLPGLLTRLTARSEPNFPSFFWPAVIGAVVMTFIGVPKWQEVAAHDWPWMFAYAAVSVLSNWLLLKTYELAEASAVQPFAYMQFVFITIIGIFVFGESLSVVVVLGVALVIAAGIYALISERKPRNG
jgi:uncharacterized membrane protein